MKIRDIKKFANTHGYDTVAFLKKWKGYDVYEPINEDNKISFVGLPLVILVKNSEIRMSTPEEALQI